VKQCPNCKNNLADYVPVCPYWGVNVAVEPIGSAQPVCTAGEEHVRNRMPEYRISESFGKSRTWCNRHGQMCTRGFGGSATGYAVSGERHFFTDGSGVIRYSTVGGADANSEPLQ
jgi:hypothetical protein